MKSLIFASLLCAFGAGVAHAQLVIPGPPLEFALATNQVGEPDFYRGVVTDVRVFSVREMRTQEGRYQRSDSFEQPQPERKDETTGAVVGGVLGAVAGNLLAPNNRALGTVLGAAGGAYAGSVVGGSRPDTVRLTVKRDDGGTSEVTQPADSSMSFERGDVVSVINENGAWRAVK